MTHPPPAARRRIAFTADDFGAEIAANAAVSECWERGVLTHASLMVAEPAFEDACERARSATGLATGLHLVLCDGRAASPADVIPDLIDSGGRFPSDPTRVGLTLWARRRQLREQIEREIRAQIERLQSAGLAISHVDGHHHLHAHPVVFGVLRPLMREYDIPVVRQMHEDRISRGLGESARWSGVVPGVHATIARWHRWRSRRPSDPGPPLPDRRVYGLRASGGIDEAYLLSLIPRLCASDVEVYCHPGRGTGGQRERDALCSPRVREAIEEAGYVLARSLRALDPAGGPKEAMRSER